MAGLLLLAVLVLGYPATREHLARWRGGRYHRFCPRYHLQYQLCLKSDCK